jgi:hypothetical protein
VRAGVDLDPADWLHEGFSIFLRLRIGRRHGHQQTRLCHALRLRARGQQPVVADAFGGGVVCGPIASMLVV